MARNAQERKWMKAVRRGDFEAFEQLYRAYYRRLYGFFYRLCWSDAQAEDLLQETFIKLWSNSQSFDLNKPLAPWLYQVGKNLFLDYERNRKSRARRELGFDDEDFAANRSNTGGSHPSGDPSTVQRQLSALTLVKEAPDRRGKAPDSALSKRETESAVRQALETLDADKRLVVVLSFYQGLPYHEIAEILGIPEGTVKSRMHHAEKQLRVTLKPLMSQS